MRRRFSLIGKIRGEDDFPDNSVPGTGKESFKSEVSRSDSFHGRKATHDDVIEPPIGMGLLHHVHIYRGLNDTEQAPIAPWRSTERAYRRLGEVVATLAVPQGLQGCKKRIPKLPRPAPIPLQQVESHALGRFRTDTRQAAQGLDQALEA